MRRIIFRIKKELWNRLYSFRIIYQPYRYKRIIKVVRKKNKIRIVFLIQLASSWKYDYLFNLFLNDERFDPLIIGCPIINPSYDDEAMFDELNSAVDFFRNKGYPVYNSWDVKNQIWINVKKLFQPDIVFFSNPWDDLSRPEYYIYNFLDTLSCYAPYGFKSSHLYEAIFNKPFQNLLWKIFYETETHKHMAAKFAINKGANGVATGYPGMDNMLDESYKHSTPWKLLDSSMKRIIWSPHHSIFGKADSNVGFSTFLIFSDTMLSIANEYRADIQISFKPHPLLKPKLYNHKSWGKEKTDMYYDRWACQPNTQLNEGNYIDLFLTSDGIINDGESFMVEYLYTGKPPMFLIADEMVTERFNDFGKQTFDYLYHGNCESDIHGFIKNVIILGNDFKKKDRVGFYEDFVKPPNNKLASENIYQVINEAIS